jgi:DNA polymerase-1
LAEEYLPEDERKVHPTTIDPADFWLAHSSEVAERCISDARLAWRIHEVTHVAIERESLERVLALEDRVILPVVEMERNGCRIDRGKLERWISEVDKRVEQRTIALSAHLSSRAINPDKASDCDFVFARLRLEKPLAWDDEAEDYVPSWSGLDTVDHPVARDLLAIRRLKSIKSKYLTKYLQALDGNNILRYNLHQLRSDNNSDSPNKGTVTGRFSSGGGEHSINIQQVFKAKKQIAKMGPDFLIRELIIPEDGLDLGASDAAQIEFRLFAHYANDPTLTEAYAANPRIDFYKQVAAIAEVERDHAKVISLAKLYAMGLPKLSRSLNLACDCGTGFRCDCDMPANNYQHGCGRAAYRHPETCPARRTIAINEQYDIKFPAAKKLSKAATKTAENRGYVHTLMGRRRRYPTRQRLHSALNAIIQGSAADIFKTKLCEMYDARNDLGITLRAPVHDEEVYDIVKDDRCKRRVQDLLDFQSHLLRVPILWESGFGSNWREANEDKIFMEAYLNA